MLEPHRATLSSVYRHLHAVLTAAGFPAADLDARWLTAHAANVEAQTLTLTPDAPLSADGVETALAFLKRRLGGEPVDRILGFREFWGLRFQLSADTLSPRPDTETLMDAAIAAFVHRSPPSRILDLGTGSGALLDRKSVV